MKQFLGALLVGLFLVGVVVWYVLRSQGMINEATASRSATDRSLAERFAEVYNVKNYGAVGNGTTDDQAALNNTQVAATTPTNGGAMLFPPGDYVVATNLTLNADVTLIFLKGARLKPSMGITVTINGQLQAPIAHIFTGDGTIAFGDGAVMTVYPEWWGAVGDDTGDGAGTNDATAIVSMFTALAQSTTPQQWVDETDLKGRTAILTRSYRTDSALNLTASGTVLRFEGGRIINNVPVNEASRVAALQIDAITE